MSIEAITYVKTIDLGDRENTTARLLLQTLAEGTFNDCGFCKLSRDELAWQLRVSSKTVQRTIASLADAPAFLKVHPRWKEGGGRLADQIELVGFVDWLDGIRNPAKSIPDKLSSMGGHTGHQESSLNRTPGVQYHKEATRTSTRTLPPTPQGAESGGDRSKFEDVFETFTGPKADKVIECFLRPMSLEVRIEHPHPRELFAAIIRDLGDESEAVLERAAIEIARSRSKVIAPKNAFDAVAIAKQVTPKAAGSSIMISRAEQPNQFAAWHAWANNNRMAEDPAIRRRAQGITRLIEQAAVGTIAVASEWPPAAEAAASATVDTSVEAGA